MFTFVTFMFIICVFVTVTSFNEVPLWLLDASVGDPNTNQGESDEINKADKPATYGAISVS